MSKRGERISTYTAGDTLPPFERTAFKGEAIDLTDATMVLKLKRCDGYTLTKTITKTLTADGQITDEPGCVYNFLFTSADLIAGLNQQAEIEHQPTGGGNKTESLLWFDIVEQV